MISAAATMSRRDAPVEPELVRGSLWQYIEASGLPSLIVGSSKDPNAKVTVLLVSPESGRPVLAIKAPTTDDAARAVEAERRALVGLARLELAHVGDTIPRVVETVEFEGRPALVTTALRGTPMMTSYLGWLHTARRSSVEADFAAVDAWLAAFQACTADGSVSLDIDSGVGARLSTRFSDDRRIEGDLEQLRATRR